MNTYYYIAELDVYIPTDKYIDQLHTIIDQAYKQLAEVSLENEKLRSKLLDEETTD